MLTPQQHAARLRYLHGYITGEKLKQSLLAGIEALEAQGRWRAGHYRGQNYLIPVGREKDWLSLSDAQEPIAPEWAIAVPDDVVITGWER